MKDDKEIVKNIILEKLLEIDNYYYTIEIGNLELKITTKKINQILINNSFYFGGGIDIDSNFVFINHYRRTSTLSYKHIWSKIERETNFSFDNDEDSLYVNKIINEYFNLN